MQISGQELFVVTFVIIAAFLVFLPILLLMRYLTPKVIVNNYFKEPHFSKAELSLLSHFPGSLVRTIIFMTSCIREKYREGRKLKGFLDQAPGWYQQTSKFLIVIMMAHIILMALSFAALMYYTWVYG